MRCTRGHAPFLSFRWTFELSLTGWGEKKRGWVTAHPSFFSLALRWWRLSQHNSREPQTVFALVSVDTTHTFCLDFVPPTSGFRAGKFRNLFGALFLFFFSFSYFLSKFGKSFWFKRYDSRIIGCRLKSLLNQKHGKRRYVPRYEQRFILHILHIFPRLEQLAIHSWHVMQQRWASLSWNATCPGAVNEPREGCGWLGLRMEKK